VFAARPPATPSSADLRLTRFARQRFPGPAAFLDDADNRERVTQYLTDMAGPLSAEPSGQSYGEMAEALIGPLVPESEPVDLLVLAFSIHDMRPGRQTAAYLSDVVPGAPMAFAICDQGSAAAFTGLRIAREYASSAGTRRALLIVAEQSGLPYIPVSAAPVPLPAEHRAVALLFSDEPGPRPAAPDLAVPRVTGPRLAAPRVTALRQHADVAPADAAKVAAAALADLASSQVLILNSALAALWPDAAADHVHAMPPGQPATEVWWGLLDALTDEAAPGVLVAADYDPTLRYLSLAAFTTDYAA
jgi:hypothetical protein